MSAEESEPADPRPALEAGHGERPPAPEVGSESPPRMRRRLFGGLRPEDVERAIVLREEQIEELRRDLAALWLAFEQQEKAIRRLEARLDDGVPRAVGQARDAVDVGPATPPAPPERPSSPEAASASSPPHPPESVGGETVQRPSSPPAQRTAVGEQLAELDEVLAAIERATKTLERAYEEEIAQSPEGDRTTPGGDGAEEEQRAGG